MLPIVMPESVTNPPETSDTPPQGNPSDPAVLREIYVRHAAEILRIAYRIVGSRSDAEDIMQDVFVGLPEALRSFRGHGSFAGWLRRVTIRVALISLRTRRRRREIGLSGQFAGMTARGDRDVIDREALTQAVASLPDSLRLVFVLKEVEGFSHTEVAELLGIGVGASEVRLHRAKAKLRQLLRSSR